MTDLISHSGFRLPSVGFGTYKLNGHAGSEAVSAAVAAGYRLFDSAFNYENEGAVAHGLRAAEAEGTAAADDLIFTSKLPGRHHDSDAALRTIEESVFRAGGRTIDLYLIHWPNPITDKYVDAWKALIAARDRGLVRHIGVSNFLPDHLDRLERETGELPVVNQIELHPHFPQHEALEFHRERGILTEGWSPLGRAGDILEEPAVLEVAAAHGITPAQAVIAWHVGRGVIPLPKSENSERQRENLAAAAVVLGRDEIDAISALGRPNGRRKDQDPARYEEF